MMYKLYELHWEKPWDESQGTCLRKIAKSCKGIEPIREYYYWELYSLKRTLCLTCSISTSIQVLLVCPDNTHYSSITCFTPLMQFFLIKIIYLIFCPPFIHETHLKVADTFNRQYINQLFNLYYISCSIAGSCSWKCLTILAIVSFLDTTVKGRDNESKGAIFPSRVHDY